MLIQSLSVGTLSVVEVSKEVEMTSKQLVHKNLQPNSLKPKPLNLKPYAKNQKKKAERSSDSIQSKENTTQRTLSLRLRQKIQALSWHKVVSKISA